VTAAKRKVARATKSATKAGAKAPAFALPDADGATVRLADFRGRWLVLYAYPKDDTPGCTVEACEFTALAPRFEALGADVVGVSPDAPERHAKFAAKHGLSVRLLSDPTHATLSAYGGWGEKTMYGKKVVGVIRSTTLVCPNASIAWRWPKVRAAGHAQAVLEKLRELQAAAAGA
jgi:peroxiredoxin Q/BCP